MGNKLATVRDVLVKLREPSIAEASIYHAKIREDDILKQAESEIDKIKRAETVGDMMGKLERYSYYTACNSGEKCILKKDIEQIAQSMLK